MVVRQADEAHAVRRQRRRRLRIGPHPESRALWHFRQSATLGGEGAFMVDDGQVGAREERRDAGERSMVATAPEETLEPVAEERVADERDGDQVVSSQ